MKLNNKIRLAAVGVVTLGLVAGASMVASATTQTNGSDAALYVYDTNGDVVTNAAQTWQWDDDISASSSVTDFGAPFTCPVLSTGVYVFLAAPGTERTASTWKASSVSAFQPGTKELSYAGLKPDTFTDGANALAKAAGGNYSLGIACTTDNGVNVNGAFFRSISVTPVTGVYTIAAPADAVVTPPPTTAPPVVAGPQNGTVALAPATTLAANGVLALTVPTNAAATFSAPSLVGNKSTSVGSLGAITVNDQRVVTREGWDLNANVADFTTVTPATATGNNIISKTQLGLAPSVTAAGSTAVGATAAAAQVAGSATYPAAFASAAANQTVGDSVLNAGLTFVAPQEKVVGTYTSTMTLTVVSK
ncbi:hypothetical protein [Cryobacterium zhongshanensis]|uniref:WxL domain-containing protein n=1 Tax=Cryobacterium zhongshanensis TaxID=2928153 RepID=A0AA41QYZ7_9MICO|nr:hypothetical protein [Cryobacterium zhongshanensis]MCI4659418.1 hypothetical protein [Cryobacterium zhongshanensis]